MCAHGKIADWIVLHLVGVHACTCERMWTGLWVEDLIAPHLFSVLHCGVVQFLVTPLLVLVFSFCIMSVDEYGRVR